MDGDGGGGECERGKEAGFETNKKKMMMMMVMMVVMMMMMVLMLFKPLRQKQGLNVEKLSGNQRKLKLGPRVG